MKRCHFCRTKIQGKFWSYSNAMTVCEKCYRTLPKCKSCNIPCKSGIKQKNAIYCKSCCSKSPQCSYCKSYIFGQYMKVKNYNICDHCSTSLPKCFRCKIPTKDYLKVNGYKICLTCSQEVEHCARCQIPLLQKFYQFPEDNRKFCGTCTKSRKRCDMCSKPLTIKYHQLQDRRRICNDCMKTAVKSSKAAQQILQKVLRYLAKEFAMKVPLSTGFHLVDSRTLAKIRRQQKSLGQKDIRSLGLFLRNGSKFDVYIETLLPEALCLGVIAHEYTHAWQAKVFPIHTSLLWVEGLAEWISYKALRYHGYSKQAALIPLQQDIYGQGFRKVRELENKYGTKNVLKRVTEIAKKS